MPDFKNRPTVNGVNVRTDDDEDMWQYTRYKEDFVAGSLVNGSIGDLRWYAYGSSTLAYVTSVGQPGLIRMTTPATINEQAALAMRDMGAGLLMGTTDWFDLTFRMRPTGSLDNDSLIRCGLCNATAWATLAGTINAGIYFEKAYDSSDWYICTNSAGVQTKTLVTAATQAQHKMRCVRSSSSNVIATIDGANATNLTSSNVAAVQPFITVATRVATAKFIDVDGMILAIGNQYQALTR